MQPLVSVDPETDQGSDLKAYYASRSGPDQNCWSSLFGNDIYGLNKFLDGPDIGPGGVKEMTVDEQGLGTTAPVGTTRHFVENSVLLELNQIIYDDGSCAVVLDDNCLLGVVADADTFTT